MWQRSSASTRSELGRPRDASRGSFRFVVGCVSAPLPSSPVRRLVTALLLAFTLAGCGTPSLPLLSEVRVTAPEVSPDLRGVHNHAEVQYRLGTSATVSAGIEGPDGRSWAVHDRVARPVPGVYELSLDGTVPGPGPHERQALADGTYRVVLRAEAGGRSQEVAVPLEIRDADTTPAEIENLTLLPDHISPNSDAIDDVTRVTYRLTKTARAIPFADRILPDGQRRRAWTGEERKLEAGEQQLVWDGFLSGQPLPDGTYEFGIRAADAAGNVREARQPIVVEAGGIPEAKIVWARISPTEIIRGGEVCLDATVRNTGQTVLRTEGPDPGYVYDSFDTFQSINDHAFVEHAGYWRIGLDWAGSADTAGARYPFRWGFGRDLPPGKEAEVRGCVRVRNEGTKLVFFAALIQENIAIREKGIGMVQVRVSP